MQWTVVRVVSYDPNLENVGLSLAVVARKGCINWPTDAPHILYELWITRKNCLVVQFKEILPLKIKTNDVRASPHTSENAMRTAYL